MDDYLGRSLIDCFFVSFIVAVMLTALRRTYCFDNIEEQTIIIPIIAFISLLFILLITFVISGLWQRYTDLRSTLVQDANKLQLVYRTLKQLPNTEEITENIKRYVNNTINVELNTLDEINSYNTQNNLIYRQITMQIIAYVQRYDPVVKDLLLSNIDIEEHDLQLSTKQISNTLFVIVVIVALATLVSFWFLNIKTILPLFILNFISIFVIFLCIYLVYQLSNPFTSKLIGLAHSNIYTNFYQEINST